MYATETQRWRLRTDVASAGPPCPNLQFRVKMSFLFPKTALEPAENGQIKGNSVYHTHATTLLWAEGPSKPL